MTRNGKIARLPREVRERLNTRIENGELGTELVDWLNGEAEVQRVLQEHFNARPISEQNLSEWKNGGYVEWQARQEIFDQARELDADGADLGAATGGRLTDRLATARLAMKQGRLKLERGRPKPDPQSNMSDEERMAVMNEILGMAPDYVWPGVRERQNRERGQKDAEKRQSEEIKADQTLRQ